MSGCRVDINSLPLKYQRQAYEKAASYTKKIDNGNARPKEHKYKAKATSVDGIKFDSKLEHNCYLVIRIRIVTGKLLSE